MQPAPILIKNGLIITVNSDSQVFRGDILVKSNKIVKIDKQISDPEATTFDATDYIVSPGFVQTHVHLCQALFRNLADDLSLMDWLKKRIWPLEGAHDIDSLRASAQLGLAELIMGGTTTILDMGTINHMNAVFEEMERSGIRGLSGKTMMDNGEIPESMRESTTESIDNSLALFEQWHNRADGRIRYAFAPRFVLSCTRDLLQQTFNFCADHELIFHSHAAENKDEIQLVEQLFGESNISLFEKLKIVGPNVCLAHCIWLNEREKDILKEYDIKVLHCPSANLKLGSGIAPVPEYIQRGINVSLGADGAPCNNNMNILNEMRLAALIQKPLNGPTAMDSETVFRMATIEGAKALNLDKEIGSIEVGKQADLIFCRLNQLHSIPFENIYSKVVYSSKSEDFEHSMINGDWVMQNRRLIHYDRDEIIRKVNHEIQKFIH